MQHEKVIDILKRVDSTSWTCVKITLGGGWNVGKIQGCSIML